MPINSFLYPSKHVPAPTYEVANSLRFDSGSSDALTQTPSSSGNRKTFTISLWTKPSSVSQQQMFLSADSNQFGFENNGVIFFYENNSGTEKPYIRWEPKHRDPSAWYHICLAVDTTQSTNTNRVKLYVNGTQITSYESSPTHPDQNQDLTWNTNVAHAIGRYSGSGGHYDGYMAEYVLIDGTALDPTSFGEFDSDTNIWKPIDVSGLTFGTNGFYLDFENSSSLGADVSGNGNNWTVSNLTSIDQSTDTCTNNAVTFTDTHPTASNFTISQGGLKINKSGSGTYGLYGSSIMLSSGKWYWEVKFTGDAGSDRTRAGIAHYDSVSGTSTIQDDYSGFEFTCLTSGRFSYTTVGGSATEINGFNGYSTGDIIRFALDMDNQRLYVGRNADWFNYSSSATGGDPTSGSGWLINDTTILKAPQTIYAGHAVGVSGSSELEFNFGATNTFTVSSGNSDGNGYGNFEYSVPSGYYAINTKNLAEYG